MQIAMTERDKKLIVILSIIVIVVAIGYWGIRPALKGVKEAKESIAEQEEIERLNSIKLTQVPVMEMDIASNNEEIEEMKDHFYPMMNSDEIDKYFTGMVLERGLFAYDLDIQIETIPSGLEPYQYSKAAMGLSEESADDESEDVEDIADTDEGVSYDDYDSELYMDSFDTDEEEETPTNTNVYAANVSMRIGGSEEDMIKLIDDLSRPDRRMLVKGYTWSIITETVSGDGTDLTGNDITNTYTDMDATGLFTVIDKMELNLNLTMYMYKE